MEKAELADRIMQTVQKKEYRPVSSREIAISLEIPKNAWPAFNTVIGQLECDGKILVSRSGKVRDFEKSGCVLARMQTITKTGGFATPQGGDSDVFIKKNALGGAMPTDILALKIIRSTGRSPEAQVYKILRRNFSEFTGVYHKDGNTGYIAADGGIKMKIPVAGRKIKAKNNDKVLAKFKNKKAEIVETFGPSSRAFSCCKAVLGKYHIHPEFPQEVLEEAKRQAAEPVCAQGRLDLRGEVIFTIDGATSKDLDDAVSVEKTETGYLLGVHIADVSHYVRENSKLDGEAIRRGTSIYYADNVIPMLPRELSNGICSLNPAEDRLAVSALMTLDESGRMQSYRFAKSIIRSRVKGVYEEINRIFDETAGPDILTKYQDVLASLKIMRELSQKLGALRKERGAVDIESGDCKIVTDENGRVVEIQQRRQGVSELLIEEFMLAANEAVAAFAKNLPAPLVYRVHDEPDPKRLEELAAALKIFGIDTRKLHAGVKPKEFAQVIGKVKDTGKGEVLSSLALRAMAKARYSPDCTGHFGLALQHYCHFTSPIRRYPDLAVHRILTDILQKIDIGEITRHYKSFTAQAAESSSENEVTAIQVERECESIYKAEYLSDHIGEEFDGVISSVKSFGIYIMLENSVEGLCRVENIPGDYYEYDERNLMLIGRRSRKKYALGDPARVLVARADVASGQIDFEML